MDSELFDRHIGSFGALPSLTMYSARQTKEKDENHPKLAFLIELVSKLELFYFKL